MSDGVNIPQNITAARPFADALVTLSTSTGQAESWQQALDCLAAVSETPDLISRFNDPRYDSDFWSDFMLGVCDKAMAASDQGGGQDKGFRQQLFNFIRMIAEFRSFYLFPAVAELLQRAISQMAGLSSFDVYSAIELSGEQQESLKAKLKARCGNDVEVNFHVDEKLRGGMIIRSGDWVIDGSLHGRLDKLAAQLVSA